MSDDYLWDRSGPPDAEIARLEELLRPLRQPESMVAPTVRLKPDATYGDPILLALKPDATYGDPIQLALKPDRTYNGAIPLEPDTTHAANGRREGLFSRDFPGVCSLEPVARQAPSQALKPNLAYGRLRAALAAAAVLLLAVAGWWLIHRSSSPRWAVTIFDDSPSARSRRVTGHRDLPVGGWLETSDGERALVEVADIGNVNVDSRTRVRLISTHSGAHRLQLARGTLHATILAPPGQFFVETPSATIVDLGCAYTVTTDDQGAGLVSVTLGWVGFEWRGRESLVPAGFIAATRPGVGPGTPYHADTPPAVRAALETIDFHPVSPDTSAALRIVLAASAERDEATLWHLLARVPPEERDRVFDRLAQFVPPPPSVTREGIRDGRRDMLDRWWDALGLGTASWWRQWRIQGPHS